MDTKDGKVHTAIIMPQGGRQGRVDSSTPSHPLAHQASYKEESEGARKEPETQVIQTRKDHIRHLEHHRNHSVPEPPNEHRHNKEENYDQGMSSDDYIVVVVV